MMAELLEDTGTAALDTFFGTDEEEESLLLPMLQNDIAINPIINSSDAFNDVLALQVQAEKIFSTNTYQSHVFHPYGGHGLVVKGLSIELWNTSNIGGISSTMYYVCFDSTLNTDGPLGMRLVMSIQGWLICYSNVQPHPHLEGGVDYFNEDILVSINGVDLLGTTLPEAVSRIGSCSAPKKIFACRFFKSLPGALNWLLLLLSKRGELNNQTA